MYVASAKAVKKWKRADVLEYIKSKQDELDLDDEDIKIIERNKVAGQVFITLTEEKLLAPPYNLLGGPAGAIALLIKELVQEKSEKRSFQEKNDLQTAEATYEPQNPISTSNEPQKPISTSEESQEINLQPVEAINSQNPIRFLSFEINTHLPENASRKLRYYELWNCHYSKWPSLNEFADYLHDVSKDRVHSSFKKEITVLRELFPEEHPAQLRLAQLEGQLRMKQMPRIIKKVQRRKIAKVAKMSTKQVVVKNELEILSAKQEAMKKELEILSTKKDVVKKELEVAQDSVILGAYHRIDDHYDNYHKASTLLLKRKLIADENGNDTDVKLSKKKPRIMNRK